jgi:hypothetical protein
MLARVDVITVSYYTRDGELLKDKLIRVEDNSGNYYFISTDDVMYSSEDAHVYSSLNEYFNAVHADDAVIDITTE